MDLIQGTHPTVSFCTDTLLTCCTDWTLSFLASHENLRPYAPYVGKAYGYMAALKSYTTPILVQVYNKPDLATAALLLIILFVSLKILNMVYQTFVFWVRTAVRVVFWALGPLCFCCVQHRMMVITQVCSV